MSLVCLLVAVGIVIDPRTIEVEVEVEVEVEAGILDEKTVTKARSPPRGTRLSEDIIAAVIPQLITLSAESSSPSLWPALANASDDSKDTKLVIGI